MDSTTLHTAHITCSNMFIIQLPDEIVGEIMGMANDIVEHENMKKKWSGDVMSELRHSVACEIWNDLDDVYCEYEQEVRKWKNNSGNFDPAYSQELVEKLYTMYTEHHQLLVDEIYNRCRYSVYDCPCSREHHLRSNLDQMVCDTWGIYLSNKIKIYNGVCVCGNCGYDDMVCNMMYALEHKLLWNKNW